MNSTPEQRRAADALGQFEAGLGTGPWVVEPLGEGVQAEVFLVRRGDGRPVWESHREVVLKLFKGAGPDREGVALEEFESLSLLHASLDGATIGGWNVHTPFPIFRGGRLTCLVMTRVPGRSVNSHLRATGGVNGARLGSLAGAVAGSLGRYWRGGGRPYGDLDFNNILCDFEAGALSLVDPGAPEKGFLCEGVSGEWVPASRDLGYMLFDVAASVKSYAGRPSARGRQKGLIESILLAYAFEIDNPTARARLLDEIHACARFHAARLRPGWSPAGAWRLLLRPIIFRGLEGTIERLKATASAGARELLKAGAGPAAGGGVRCLDGRSQ